MTTTTSVPTATSNSNSKPDNITSTNNSASTKANDCSSINNQNNNINNSCNRAANNSSGVSSSSSNTSTTIAIVSVAGNTSSSNNSNSNNNNTASMQQSSTSSSSSANAIPLATTPAIATASAAALASATIVPPTLAAAAASAAAPRADCLTTPTAPLLGTTSHRAVTITPILNPAITLVSQQQQNLTRTMQTDEDFNIRFVNLVRNHKCLYDKKVPEYRNRDNQEKAWMQISLETKESVIHCKERWRNLRACLSRYIKQQTGNDPQHKPYYLTEHMAFLLPFLKSTRNSLDGNSSLATLYHFSQQQQQQQQQLQHQNNSISTTLHALAAQPHLKFGDPHQQHHQLEVKHSLSDNEDEETIDAFDPAVTAGLHMHQQANHRSSPPLSDTASANTMQNFIPDVQLSEMRTPDGVQDIAYVNTHMRGDSSHHHHDFGPEPKRIKTECHASEATTTAQLHMYTGEQADMEFFRSILPDIAGLTPQQKRKLKIGILELIDDVVERYPLERSTNANVTSQTPNANAKTRRNSSRDWRK